MSPILVRPVREQLEHDRVIRLLQQDLQKRKVEVGINPGGELNAPIGSGSRKEYPDAVVYSLEKGKKVVAVVEVETGESVNHLEAMAQWAHFAKLRVPFHLYVPMGSVDVARRLSTDHKIPVTEIWSYHQVGEQFRFTLIHPPAAGRGRAAAVAPRTVSVASIRVAPPPEPELPEEPAIAAPTASASKGTPKVVSGKAKPAAAATPAKGAAPVKVVPAKAPAVSAPIPKPAASKPATNGSQKPASSKVVAAQPVAAKATAAPVKAAPPAKSTPPTRATPPSKAAASRAIVAKPARPSAKSVANAARPAVKPPAQATKAKPIVKSKAKAAVQPVKTTKSARPASKPTRNARQTATPAHKAFGKRK